MDIKKAQNGGALTITVSGRLDTNTAPQLDAEVKAIEPTITELTLDLKDLAYVSSAGLRVILAAQKLMNKQGSMIVRNPSEIVLEVFEVTGFVDILTIE